MPEEKLESAEPGSAGYWGKTLHLNVGTGESRIEPLDRSILRDFVGGRGLAAYLLFRYLPAGAHPLGPENVFVLAGGPLTGSSAPGSAHVALATKSPQTSLYLYSITGGDLGAALRMSGFDALVVSGHAEQPVFIDLRNGRATVRRASHLWGLDTFSTQEVLRREVGPEAAVTCIGPAGEHLVPYANLINERRAFGRGGAGAVLGAKNVKAVVVHPSFDPPDPADPEAFLVSVRRSFRELRSHPFTSGPLKFYGSVSTVAVSANAGLLPVNNWQRVATPEEAEGLLGETLRERYLVKDVACGDPCPARCSKLTLVREGGLEGSHTEGPEYETIYSLGTACGVFDLAPIIEADRLCDSYGMDTISVGVTIAFAMECFERGLLTRAETEGLDLCFGDAETVLALVKEAAYRRGFGQKIAQGTRALAAEIGPEAESFAMHSKGMELGGYDPRGAKGMALVYGCGNRGGCHHAGGYTVAAELSDSALDRFADLGKTAVVVGTRNRRAAMADAAGTCAFLLVGLQDETVAELLNTTTGFGLTPADLYVVGDRINALERALNVREGMTPEDDSIPGRLVQQKLKQGPTADQLVNFGLMRQELYASSGIDPHTALHRRDALANLGLEWVLSDPMLSNRMTEEAK
ncbi:MAG: aldehyde ferredoxin oxidoreductase family protein [Thermoleophilia bacterium]